MFQIQSEKHHCVWLLCIGSIIQLKNHKSFTCSVTMNPYMAKRSHLHGRSSHPVVSQLLHLWVFQWHLRWIQSLFCNLSQIIKLETFIWANQSFSLNGPSYLASPSYIFPTNEQHSQRGLPPLPSHMAESKTASMSQTAVACPSDLFGPTDSSWTCSRWWGSSFIASTWRTRKWKWGWWNSSRFGGLLI